MVTTPIQTTSKFSSKHWLSPFWKHLNCFNEQNQSKSLKEFFSYVSAMKVRKITRVGMGGRWGSQLHASCLPWTCSQAWNYFVANDLQHQYQSSSLGNVMCPFQLDGAEWLHSVAIFKFCAICILGDMSHRAHKNTSINVRQISPYIKAQNAAI